MSNEFLDKELTELEIKKGKIANILAIVVVIIGIFLCYAFMTGSFMLVGFLFLVNILFGPVTLFFYFKEVKKGIFKADVDFDEGNE